MSFGQQSGVVEEGMFDFGREHGAPTYYDENQTAWMADILEAGLISACVILLLSFYSILPGIHGKERICNFVWITASVFVGGVILVVIYSREWEKAETFSAVTKYKAGTGEDIHASIGLHIGLTGVNVTLKGEPVKQLNETINYNEEFDWTWRQGRLGFGPFASDFNQGYRASQFRGAPLPILWVAEYFTFDGEGIRWGRFYRVAGLYSYMCLWLSFGLWLLTNALVFILLRYAAYCSMLTGAFMCTANIIKHCLRNVNELEIPFSTDHVLRLEYGVAFWLCLGTGCFCILAGLIVLLMDLRFPLTIASFFSQDHLQDEKLLEREGSQISLTSNNSDLTTIVEIGRDGQRTEKMAARPTGAPTGAPSSSSHVIDNKKFTGSNLDDVYGDNVDDWSDCTLSDTPTTDDELSEEEETQPRQQTGVLSRLQRPRRPVTAKQRNAIATANRQRKSIQDWIQRRGRGRVSPEGPANQRSKKEPSHRDDSEEYL